MPLPVHERGSLVCEMAGGRQKLLAQPSLGAPGMVLICLWSSRAAVINMSHISK